MRLASALLFTILLTSHRPCSSSSRGPRSFKHLAPRVGSKFFIRANTKVNVVPYTAIFAYASGFRLNFDIRPQDNSPLFFVGTKRSHVHSTIVELLESYGIKGRDCLLRAFCDLAEIQSHTDVISNILKVVFKAEEDVSCPAITECPFSLVALPYLLYGAKFAKDPII